MTFSPSNPPMMTRRLALLAAGCGLTLALPARAARAVKAAVPGAVITILEGDATVIEGARALVAAVGLPVGEGTILRTDGRTGLLRVEWADGSVVDLGPDTQVMLAPPGLAARGAPLPSAYLLRGWLKLTTPKTATLGGAMTPAVQLQPGAGALVLHADADETWLFAESGAVQLSERDTRAATGAALKPGEVWLRAAAGHGQVSARPSPDQLKRVPRGFRDKLPLRAAALKDHPADPVPAPGPTYEDLSEWLSAERPLRRAFPRRFAVLARDKAFRAELAARLGAHPEWEPVLFPERFVKPAAKPR